MNINNCYIGKITQLVDEDMYESKSIYPYMYCITNQSQIIRTYTKREDITKHKEEFLRVTLNPNMWDDCYLRLTHVKKIEFDGKTLIDLTKDTVTAGSMLNGVTAHNNEGDIVTGNIPTKTAANLTANGKTVTVPAGYYST